MGIHEIYLSLLYSVKEPESRIRTRYVKFSKEYNPFQKPFADLSTYLIHVELWTKCVYLGKNVISYCLLFVDLEAVVNPVSKF